MSTSRVDVSLVINFIFNNYYELAIRVVVHVTNVLTRLRAFPNAEISEVWILQNTYKPNVFNLHAFIRQTFYNPKYGYVKISADNST